MDSFDFESLDRYIRKFRRNIINKLENINLSEKEMKNQADLLCMVLDYSPKMYDEKKIMKKIEIKPCNLFLPEQNEKNNTRSLILEKHVSNDENSFDSEKEQTIKLSRLSSKICNSEIFQNPNNIPNNKGINENILFIHCKDLIYEIIINSIKISTNTNSEVKYKSKINKYFNLIFYFFL